MNRPPSMDDKALVAVDSEWRTAREIYEIIGEDALITVRALRSVSLVEHAGQIDRRYEPRQAGKIAFYRRKVSAAEKLNKHLELL